MKNYEHLINGDFNHLLDWLSINKISSTTNNLQLPKRNIRQLAQNLNHEDSKKAILKAEKIFFNEKEFETIYLELKQSINFAALQIKREPADYIAAYYPFHFHNKENWGIVIDVARFLEYIEILFTEFSRASFPNAIITRLALFEIFHHEYFHHIVECMCTTFEILSPSQLSEEKVYQSYCTRSFDKSPLVTLPENSIPLEEALANAYAYNSLTFISRMQKGYKTMVIDRFQKIIEYYWTTEPKGYNAAGQYIDGKYLFGAKKLIQLTLPDLANKLDPPIKILARHIFPNGKATFFSKQNIPLYLQGSSEEITKFENLYGDVRFFCTNIFSKNDDLSIDKYFIDQLKKEKEKKKNN